MPLSFISSTVIERTKILSKFVSVQLAVKLLGLASGILLVRTLDKQEYAYFTIANTMQGTMNILADMGIGSGLSVIGGKVWQDRYRFGQLINTALKLKRYIAVIAIVAIAPILLWLLIGKGTSIIYAILISIVVLVELQFMLSNGVLTVVPRLHSQLKQIQTLDIIFVASRLGILWVAYLTFLNAAIAVFASSIASGLQYFFLRFWIRDSIDIEAPVHPEDSVVLLKIIKSQAPYFVFYCIQGQITIWLISVFGNTQNIAEVGALGRLGVLFSIIGAVMNSIILPAFARCQSIIQLRDRYWQIIGGFCLLATIIVVFTAIFPKEIIWILGKQYTHLSQEVILVVISAMTSTLAATMWSINTSKAWVQDSWLIVVSTVITQIFLLLILDVHTVKGVITFGWFSTFPTILVNGYMSYQGLQRGL
ncbi:polysaccharide biosynthesis protein [Trichocoleus sp. FACHB-90]|uniref:polysaccharide biosynthesis protein n=1 Tax=Cyanophyceae TaxID=3028117 RepID=UPI0016854199|nr:polysaccharide biosynthesis protein [Trichocoleus sp. FACHB-90]MBD1925830.1 polysaccharide biosynthesis protein [Trichocoleus sp. FACHB-90]